MQVFFFMYCAQCTGHACGCCILNILTRPPLSTCRLVPVSAPWQPGVWGPREDRVLVLLGHSVARDVLLLQGQAHSQRAAGEGGWSESVRVATLDWSRVCERFFYSVDACVSFDVELLFFGASSSRSGGKWSRRGGRTKKRPSRSASFSPTNPRY